VIYEVHVKGFTARHPDVPRELRGTYAGFASPPALDYLTRLGVTAVELLPVHHFVRDRVLADRGLANYWGYNSIGFFAPDARYAASGVRGEQVAEFKRMVRALHQAGIEVILDVVYNHTAEGNHLGPTLCFRGIDNAAYYRLVADDRRYSMDYTGCGNTLNMTHPRTLQLIMDSLRCWVLEMHVDGFRFDLASALAREFHDVALRERQMRNGLVTLLLSQGIPMLLGGDEVARSQQGYNNAYCQDNEISWFRWPPSRAALRQLEFTRRLIRLRLDQPVFHRRRFFQGRRIQGSEVKDLSWFRPDGKEMTEAEWADWLGRCLGLRLAGDAIEEVDEQGRPIAGDTFLVLLNAHWEPVPFVLPAHRARVRWEPVLDTRAWDLGRAGRTYRAGEGYPLEGRSAAVLRLRGPRRRG
jgi:pullulanase/glycogen debranching enzyme